MATNSTDEREDLELPTGDDLETRIYELGFHLDPELPQEEVKKTYQDIRGRVAALATVIAEGEPTKIPLAYTISRSETGGRRDFTSAYFCWIAYEANTPAHEEIGTVARTESRIVRFIDILTTRDAAQHSAEMHDLFMKNATEEDIEDMNEVASEEAIIKEAE